MPVKFIQLTVCSPLFLAVLLGGCASSLRPDEAPVVNVNYIKILPVRGIAPEFEIGLHIINPNEQRLALKGISYTVSIEGHRIVMGVSDRLPAIEAFSEGDVVIRAGTDVLSSIRLLTDLMGRDQKSLAYEFNARLTVTGFSRRIDVVRKGEIDLSRRTGV